MLRILCCVGKSIGKSEASDLQFFYFLVVLESLFWDVFNFIVRQISEKVITK